MNISNEEKEQLFEEFKTRLLSPSVDKTKSASYRNQHNLAPARNHFKNKRDDIRKEFHTVAYMSHGINWPDWSLITRLVCHSYGVSTIGRISDDLLESANKMAIQLVDTLFNTNEETLRRVSVKED